MNSQQRAYLAGLLDGDGSIMLQIRERKKMKLLFRIKAVVVFYQDSRHISDLKKFQKWIGAGYVYKRNDHISELRVEGHARVEQLLTKLKPYIRFKKLQVKYMLKAIKKLSKKQTIEEFLEVCDLADDISATNYVSRNRKYTAEYVRNKFFEHNLIPVTTGLSNNHRHEDR